MTEPLLDAGALEGVRVLELGTAIVGPYCAQNLADLGAEVVKIEPPGGDPVRLLAGFAPNESKLFHTLNRGKRSVVLDLRGEAGREAVRRLIPGFDVFVINTRPGVPQRLGIDYETLRGLREDLIYVEHTSYGTRGPDARRPGGDVVIQAYSGLMAAESKIDEFGAPQRMSSTVLSDYAGGIAGAMGVCAALYRRERTGRGQYISAPLVAAAVSFLSYYVSRLPAVDAVTSDPMLERVRAVREGGGGYREVLEARGLQVLTQNAAGLLYTNGYSVRDGAIVLGAVSPENRDQIRAALGIEDDPTADPDFNALDPRQLAADRGGPRAHPLRHARAHDGRVDGGARRRRRARLARQPARGGRRRAAARGAGPAARSRARADRPGAHGRRARRDVGECDRRAPGRADPRSRHGRGADGGRLQRR